jgi:hypothetical protein
MPLEEDSAQKISISKKLLLIISLLAVSSMAFAMLKGRLIMKED